MRREGAEDESSCSEGLRWRTRQSGQASARAVMTRRPERKKAVVTATLRCMHSEQRRMFTVTYSHHGNQTALRLPLSPPVDDKQVLNFASLDELISFVIFLFFFCLFTASQSHSLYKYQLRSVKRGTNEGLRSALDTISAEKKHWWTKQSKQMFSDIM